MQKKQSRWMKNVITTASKTDVELPWSRQARAAKRNTRKRIASRG